MLFLADEDPQSVLSDMNGFLQMKIQHHKQQSSPPPDTERRKAGRWIHCTLVEH
jgi:hypothetical protein